MPPEDPRPPLLKLGIALLVVHELVVIALCALSGAVGAILLLMGAASDPGEEAAPFLLLAAGMGGLLLLLLVGCAVLSLVVCALAWRGSATWLKALIGVALLNCIVVVPNPLGILAAVFCVLGGLDALGRPREPVAEPEPD